jgi:hypothetical protein
MTGQHQGNMIVELMRTIDRNTDIPIPEVEVGGVVVTVDGVRVSIGPEVLESFRELEAQKRQAIANGDRSPLGTWQPGSEEVKNKVRAVVAAAGFPGLFD